MGLGLFKVILVKIGLTVFERKMKKRDSLEVGFWLLTQDIAFIEDKTKVMWGLKTVRFANLKN